MIILLYGMRQPALTQITNERGRVNLDPALPYRDVHASHEVKTTSISCDGEALAQPSVETVADLLAVVPRPAIINIDGADNASRGLILRGVDNFVRGLR